MSEKYRNPEFEAKISKYDKHYRDYLNCVNETLSEIDTVHGPFWKAKNDFLKLIVGLSSGALALIFAFSKTILYLNQPNENITPIIRILLFSVYIIFFISINSGVISIWFSSKIKAVHIWFYYNTQLLTESINKMKEKDCYEEEDFNDLFSKPFERVRKYDNYAGKLLTVSFYSYLSALLVFSVLFGLIFFS